MKSVATWAYWEGGGTYAVGTNREGSPYFEALQGRVFEYVFKPCADYTKMAAVGSGSSPFIQGKLPSVSSGTKIKLRWR